MNKRFYKQQETEQQGNKGTTSLDEEGQLWIIAIALYQELLDQIAGSSWLMEQANTTRLLEESDGAEPVALPGGTATDYRCLCLACLLFVKNYRTPLTWAIKEVEARSQTCRGSYKELFKRLVKESSVS